MKDEPKQEMQPRLHCPHCDVEITNIEIRNFGPNGLVVIFGCQNCLKPLPANIVPVAPQEEKSPIITP